jgi:glycosyltransferase involved in cell wall biosynthesis
LHEQRWRAVVIDQAACGWAVTQLARAKLPIVYLAHNHEASVRRQVALAEPSRPRRWLMQADAAKYARLEQILVGQAALVTAITDNDARTFAEAKPITSILTLPPGYSGRVLPHRVLTPATPRKVVVVGKFEWIAKQLNLARWAHEAVPLLSASGIETQVIGTVPSALQARLTRPGLSFTGPVADIQPHLCNARFGLVAEEVGGGFKLKTLDYLLHRLPIAALDGNLAGLPKAITANAMVADTPRALAGRIIARIDDLEHLNQMQHNAFRAAQTAFDWEEGARRFLLALDRLDQNA